MWVIVDIKREASKKLVVSASQFLYLCFSPLLLLSIFLFPLLLLLLNALIFLSFFSLFIIPIVSLLFFSFSLNHHYKSFSLPPTIALIFQPCWGSHGQPATLRKATSTSPPLTLSHGPGPSVTPGPASQPPISQAQLSSCQPAAACPAPLFGCCAANPRPCSAPAILLQGSAGLPGCSTTDARSSMASICCVSTAFPSKHFILKISHLQDAERKNMGAYKLLSVQLKPTLSWIFERVRKGMGDAAKSPSHHLLLKARLQ